MTLPADRPTRDSATSLTPAPSTRPAPAPAPGNTTAPVPQAGMEGALQPLLRVEQLKKYYPARGAGRGRQVRAVDGVDLTLVPGQVLALLGESGCGKSTLGRTILRLEKPTGGRITFAGTDVMNLRGQALKNFRRQAQIVFQNPYESFDGRYTVGQSLLEPIRIHRLVPAREQTALVDEILERAGLHPARDFRNRFPHELSGGQLQRVSLARAMLLQPRLLVADEPVSMLDVSVRAGILNMLADLADRGTAVLFITHDVAVARYLARSIAVMYLGKIVEQGPADELLGNPAHPYTRALIASVPSPDPAERLTAPPVRGEPTNPLQLPPGCRFASRCPDALPICSRQEPPLRPWAHPSAAATTPTAQARAPHSAAGGPRLAAVEPDLAAVDSHLVACHLWG